MQDNQRRVVLVCVSDLEIFHVLKLVKGSVSSLLEVVQCSTCCKVNDYTDILHTLAEVLLAMFNNELST